MAAQATGGNAGMLSKPVDAGDFFDQVLFDLDVEAVAGGVTMKPRRYRRLTRRWSDSPRRVKMLAISSAVMGTPMTFAPAIRIVTGLRSGHVERLVVHRAGLAHRRFQDQRADTVRWARMVSPIDAPLKRCPASVENCNGARWP